MVLWSQGRLEQCLKDPVVIQDPDLPKVMSDFTNGTSITWGSINCKYGLLSLLFYGPLKQLQSKKMWCSDSQLKWDLAMTVASAVGTSRLFPGLWAQRKTLAYTVHQNMNCGGCPWIPKFNPLIWNTCGMTLLGIGSTCFKQPFWGRFQVGFVGCSGPCAADIFRLHDWDQSQLEPKENWFDTKDGFYRTPEASILQKSPKGHPILTRHIQRICNFYLPRECLYTLWNHQKVSVRAGLYRCHEARDNLSFWSLGLEVVPNFLATFALYFSFPIQTW